MNNILRFLAVIFFVYWGTGNAFAQEVLSWEECLREAQKNHPDLISAEEGVKISQSQRDITASDLFPQIESGVSAERSGGEGKPTNSFSFGVSGTQLLFNGFKTVNDLKAARETLKAFQQKYRFTSSEVRFRLRSAFIDSLRAQQLIFVTDDIRKIRKDNLQLINLRYESGLEHKGALLTARADMARADYESAQAKRNLEVSLRVLFKEMGRPPQETPLAQVSSVTVQGDFGIGQNQEEHPDFEALAKNNPSLQQFLFQENAAAYGVKSAYGNFFPSISAQGGAGKSGSKWPPGDNDWNAGVTLSFPLFEGGLKKAQLNQAKALYRQAQADRRSTSDSVVVTLEERWAAFEDAIEAVDVQNQVLIAAQERAKIAEAQYSEGFISYDNWSIIEDNLVQAKKSYLDAQANAALAQAQWTEAKGETLEYAQK